MSAEVRAAPPGGGVVMAQKKSALYEGRNELGECLENDGRSVASTVRPKRHKTSRFGL